MRRYYAKHSDGSAREVVAAAFKVLRKRGYLARMNFLCCGGCAGYALAEKATELVDKGKSVTGGVFFHKQDQQRYEECGELYLAFGQVGTSKHGDVGKETVEVGKELVEVLHTVAGTVGVEVQWDGSEHARVLVVDKSVVEARQQQ